MPSNGRSRAPLCEKTAHLQPFELEPIEVFRTISNAGHAVVDNRIASTPLSLGFVCAIEDLLSMGQVPVHLAARQATDHYSGRWYATLWQRHTCHVWSDRSVTSFCVVRLMTPRFIVRATKRYSCSNTVRNNMCAESAVLCSEIFTIAAGLRGLLVANACDCCSFQRASHLGG